ncbi:MAG: hypothetical protein ACHRXM_12995 [Isosphaerales bacterium]
MKTAREKRSVMAAAVGLMAIGLVMRGQAAETLRATPPIRDPAMPSAPRQGQQWTPPQSALPRFFVRATAVLFEQGMADPRECEYRSVRLVGESGLYKDPAAPWPVTHAWVLPEGARDGPRFAVAWRGFPARRAYRKTDQPRPTSPSWRSYRLCWPTRSAAPASRNTSPVAWPTSRRSPTRRSGSPR